MIFRKKKSAKQIKKNTKRKNMVSKESPKTVSITQKESITKPEMKPEPILDYSEKEKLVSKKEKTAKCENYEKEFLKVFKQLSYRYNEWEVWKDFIVMFACALSNPIDKTHYEEREKRYLEIIHKYKKQDQNLFPELCACTIMALEYEPEQDFLGKLFTDLNLKSHAKGQFFTPYHLCRLMASIAEGDVVTQVEEGGYITIADSSCGGGATLIAGVHEARRQLEKVHLNFQNHILVAAQDLDETVALMCYIQLSLLGVAAYIKVGDTFTDPICVGDSMDHYWFTPMYFSDVWTTRRLIKKLEDVL